MRADVQDGMEQEGLSLGPKCWCPVPCCFSTPLEDPVSSGNGKFPEGWKPFSQVL